MKTKFLSSTIASFLSISLLVSAAGLHAQEPQKPATDAASKEAEKDADKTPEKDATADPKKADEKEIIALVGGDILTVMQETIRGGTILIEGTKISAIGHNIDIPEKAKRIDVSGKILTPGFVAIDMSGVGLNVPTDRDGKYSDGLDPFDRNVSLSLGVGITTGCIQVRSGGSGRRRRDPGEDFPVNERFIGLDPDQHQLSAEQEQTERDFGEYVSVCKCCGLPILPTEPITPAQPTAITPQKNAVLKMSYGKLDGMLVAENAFLDMTPGSLSGALNQRTWRENIEKARTYLAEQAAHEKSVAAGKKEQPPRKPVSDEIIKLVQGKIALRISASSVSEIRDMIALSKELDYKLVIADASEAWVLADELSEGGTSVILTPRSRRNARFGEEDRSGTWIETPRVMEQTGVPFAVSALSSSISLGGLAGRDLTSLPLEAAFAVRGGASERKALESITIAPARMLGLGDRIGSLEVGKDADILVLNGQPLDYRTYVETAIVNGRVCYERATTRVLPVYDRN